MDMYKLKSFPRNYFDYVVDIGANVGKVSTYIAARHKQAKIFCYEPNKENFKVLLNETKDMPQIKCFNVALGDGSQMFLRCVESIEGHFVVNEGGDYVVETQSLADIFKNNQIDVSKKVFLKIDCEGGERFLLGNEINEKYMLECEYIAMEIHVWYDGMEENGWWKWKELYKFEDYDNWIRNKFAGTHDILYISSKRRKRGHYFLTKKSIKKDVTKNTEK